MHVSLAAEKLFSIGPINITNSLLTTWLVIAGILSVAVIIRLKIKKTPEGIQNVVEAVIEGFHGIVDSVASKPKQARKFFPLIFTIFLFVLLNNWAGLIPGVGSVGFYEGAEHTTEEAQSEVAVAEEGIHEEVVNHDEAVEENAHAESHTEEGAHDGGHGSFVPIFRAGTADLSFTFALAFSAVFMVQVMGMSELGFFKYWGKFFNFKDPIMLFVGILELVGEFSKMISFSFRLFGNIFAGEVLLTVIIALMSFIAPMPFYGLEIFVGLIQALVFAMLTLVFTNMAVAEHH